MAKKKILSEENEEKSNIVNKLRTIKVGEKTHIFITNCHACNSADTKIYHKSGRVRYFKCRNCSHTFKEVLTNPVTNLPI